MRALFISILFLSVLAVRAQKTSEAQNKKSKPVTVFTVDNHPVNSDEFIYLYKKNNTGKPESTSEAKIQEYLDLFINFKLKVIEAIHRGMDTTAVFKKEFKSYSEDLKKPYLAEADDIERLTREAYQRLTEEIKASHILVNVSPDASPADTLAAYTKIMALRKRITDGEDFEKLAREFSEDPSAKTNGGSLGYFTSMQMVYAFEDAAYKLTVGGLSNPVRTRFGYHLIKLYDRKPSRGEVEVSHIMFSTAKGDAASKTKDKAFEVYDQLKGGRNWDELCKEYSDDTSTKNSGGRLRPFGVGVLSQLPEFESVVFALQQPGDISDPFLTSYGWHIVRLERKIPVPSYEELQASLKRKVSRDERLQIVKASSVEKKKKTFGLKEAQDSKDLLALLTDSTRFSKRNDPVFAKKVLFTLSTGPVYFEDFTKYAFAEKKAAALPQETVSSLYASFVEQKLNEAEEKKLIADNPEYKSLLNEYREGILLFSIMEKEVWTKASEDTTGQHTFYEQFKTKYTAGERVEARLFATSDKTFLEKIKSKIAAGDSLTREDLKTFKSVLNFRTYEKGENKAVDKVSWSHGLHETEDNGMYYLVEVSHLIAPGVKSFEDARAQIISDYQDKLEKDWLAKLKSKYPVVINKKGKKIVFRELEKDAVSK